MENGAIVTAYADTGLGSEETRHYRVFAINGEGRSLASDVAHATTGDIAGPEPASASVAASGRTLTIVFDEALDAAAARLPAAARFEISAADGAEIAIGADLGERHGRDAGAHERLRRHPDGPGGDGGLHRPERGRRCARGGAGRRRQRRGAVHARAGPERDGEQRLGRGGRRARRAAQARGRGRGRRPDRAEMGCAGGHRRAGDRRLPRRGVRERRRRPLDRARRQPQHDDGRQVRVRAHEPRARRRASLPDQSAERHRPRCVLERRRRDRGSPPARRTRRRS